MFEYRIVENGIESYTHYDDGPGSFTHADQRVTSARVIASGYYGDGPEVLLAIHCEWTMGHYDHLLDNRGETEYSIERRKAGEEFWSICDYPRIPEPSEIPEGYNTIWDWYHEYVSS